ncbi:hypothetical protein D3C83_00730 [compost metagenome]
MECLRRDADDRQRTAVDDERPAGNVRRQAALPPQAVADDDSGAAAGALFGTRERPPASHRNTKRREVVRRHDHGDGAGRHPALGDADTRRRLGEQVREHVVAIPDLDVLGIRERSERIGPLHVPGVEADNLAIAGHDRPQQEAVDETEKRRVGADAKGEHHDRGGGEAGRFAQHADGESNVLAERVERGHAAAIAVGLARGLETARRRQRAAARLVGRDATPDLLVDLHGEMRLHFGLELAYSAPRCEQAGDTERPRAHRSHDASPGDRKRAMISVA